MPSSQWLSIGSSDSVSRNHRDRALPSSLLRQWNDLWLPEHFLFLKQLPDLARASKEVKFVIYKGKVFTT